MGLKPVKAEYVWCDGYTPEPNLRSKTKVLRVDSNDPEIKLESLPMWSFDGSSTQQAEGGSSDCLLKPVRILQDPTRYSGILVMCEVLNADGTPHESNHRAKLAEVVEKYNVEEGKYWFGFEQEYFLKAGDTILGFPKDGEPDRPQGEYYCAVGNENVKGREFVEHHLDMSLNAGLNITGINAEVCIGQWEYQLFGMGALRTCDHVMLSRYLLLRAAESFNLEIELHPKPVQGDWNGSGCHINFSNPHIREVGGEESIKEICDKFGARHDEHIEVYGSSNEMRLTGLHETQHISKFSYGVSDRGASIRIPVQTVADGWKGYLEDRRPASNVDPYRAVAVIVETLEA